jgi:hemerythrin-like domain-containing protein
MTSGTACDHLRKDHREMEVCLDRLLAALQRLDPELIAEVQAAVREIRRLSAIHFEKEEVIFYPSLRPAFPDLMAQMDRQHDEVREVEQHVEELLSDPPRAPEPRWLNDVRLFGTELYDLIQHHIVEEEDQLFRLAESRLTGEDQERLSAEMMKVYSRPSAS